jgi:hypothetical protein
MNDIAPPNGEELWMYITLKIDWESPLPDRYLAPLAPNFPGVGSISGSSNLSGITGATRSSTATDQTGTDTQQRRPPVNTKRKAAPDDSVAEKCVPYVETFAPYRATGKRVREVVRAAADAGNPIPKGIAVATCACPTTLRASATPTAAGSRTTSPTQNRKQPGS